MTTAAEFRAEAARMREFARTVTDPEVLAETHAMVEEWARRAREQATGRPATRGSRMVAWWWLVMAFYAGTTIGVMIGGLNRAAADIWGPIRRKSRHARILRFRSPGQVHRAARLSDAGALGLRLWEESRSCTPERLVGDG